jgi:hypothetical protein
MQTVPCPDCGGKGCAECDGDGRVSVSWVLWPGLGDPIRNLRHAADLLEAEQRHIDLHPGLGVSLDLVQVAKVLEVVSMVGYRGLDQIQVVKDKIAQVLKASEGTK